MTEQQHPITPPPGLLQQWSVEYWGNPGASIGEGERYIAIQAARWGSDQELEKCCEWLQDPDLNVDTYKLRAARRPKPPSLKEQALSALEEERADMSFVNYKTIQSVLEQLDD